MQLWARVVHGLEWVAAAEAAMLLGPGECRLEHRGFVFACSDFHAADRLRCVDDVFAVWGEFAALDRHRVGLADLAGYLARLAPPPLVIPPEAQTLRISASFLGARNYSRYDLEDRAGAALASRLGLRYAQSRAAVAEDAVWCRLHATAKYTRLALRTRSRPLHRRGWRTHPLAGSLHPPVAAAMARLADLAPGQVVLDPFAGAGTLLIEAGLCAPGLRLAGSDLSAQALGRACAHAKCAGIALGLAQADAAQPALRPAARLLANPPWGHAAAVRGAVRADRLAEVLLAHLQPSGRAVIIADRDLGLADRLGRAGVRPLLCQTVRLAGRLAELVVIGPPPLFPATELGRQLRRFALASPP